jgi:hypothetical protein
MTRWADVKRINPTSAPSRHLLTFGKPIIFRIELIIGHVRLDDPLRTEKSKVDAGFAAIFSNGEPRRKLMVRGPRFQSLFWNPCRTERVSGISPYFSFCMFLGLDAEDLRS